MTTSFTISSTFTRTHASYLASKIAADLFQMQLFYGRPSDKEVEDYLGEAIILLLGGYLESVAYGFKRQDNWMIALKYTAYSGGILRNDDRSGRVTPGVDISGAAWYSFLTYSQEFHNLLPAEREQIRKQLPINRTNGEEPKSNGSSSSDKSYSNGGVSLQRQTLLGS